MAGAKLAEPGSNVEAVRTAFSTILRRRRFRCPGRDRSRIPPEYTNRWSRQQDSTVRAVSRYVEDRTVLSTHRTNRSLSASAIGDREMR